MKAEMKEIAELTNSELGTPFDVQLFFTYQTICGDNGEGGEGCLNGYSYGIGSLCLNPMTSVSVTAGGHKKSNGDWSTRSILQTAGTCAHELGMLN